MRAAVMRNKKLVVDNIPAPEPGPGEVLVKTLACGICGSDLHTLKHAEKLVEASRRSGGIFNMDLSRDIVMGHEFCAEIVDHGPGTRKHLKVGTRVCSIPVLFRPNGPHTVGYSNDNPGGYGEYMRLTEALLLTVPNGLSTERAALTEPMAVGLHAVEKARLEKDDVLREALGEARNEDYVDYFIHVKRDEWTRYHEQVTPWEIKEYLTRF